MNIQLQLVIVTMQFLFIPSTVLLSYLSQHFLDFKLHGTGKKNIDLLIRLHASLQHSLPLIQRYHEQICPTYCTLLNQPLEHYQMQQ